MPLYPTTTLASRCLSLFFNTNVLLLQYISVRLGYFDFWAKELGAGILEMVKELRSLGCFSKNRKRNLWSSKILAMA